MPTSASSRTRFDQPDWMLTGAWLIGSVFIRRRATFALMDSQFSTGVCGPPVSASGVNPSGCRESTGKSLFFFRSAQHNQPRQDLNWPRVQVDQSIRTAELPAHRLVLRPVEEPFMRSLNWSCYEATRP